MVELGKVAHPRNGICKRGEDLLSQPPGIDLKVIINLCHPRWLAIPKEDHPTIKLIKKKEKEKKNYLSLCSGGGRAR
jgi:hypothetical protein